MPSGPQTRITLHLSNIKWITGLTVPRLSSLMLTVFRPNTCYKYNLKVYNICIVQNQNFCPVSLLTLLNRVCCSTVFVNVFSPFLLSQKTARCIDQVRGGNTLEHISISLFFMTNQVKPSTSLITMVSVSVVQPSLNQEFLCT